MQRVTISIDDSLAREFDDLVRSRGYQSRSEAFRDLVREAITQRRIQVDPTSSCVANLSYVFNHRERMLAKRLLSMQHEHHDLVAASLRVHLDHDHCIESIVLRGSVEKVAAFADEVQAERGVSFGSLNLISVQAHDHHSSGKHPHHHHHDAHAHLSPSLTR